MKKNLIVLAILIAVVVGLLAYYQYVFHFGRVSFQLEHSCLVFI